MYPNNNCDDCPPCPGTITPLPLPDLSGLCGDEYNAACVIYTGPDITCLGIESGMTFLEVLAIFNNILPGCDCCEKVPVNCVVGPWGPWSQCECYYEDELLVCGRETRTRSVITPPQNGGTACPPLVEYRPCDLPDVCFTFGSGLCETQPDPIQILASPAGLLNGKPYYKLEFFCESGAPDLYVWYNDNTELWHITPTLNETDGEYQTLNNNSNYLPISNNTTQRWSTSESGQNYLISTQTTTCPDVKICFQYTIIIYNSGGLTAQAFTYYTYIAPTFLGGGSFPVYQWSINTPDGVYNMQVSYGTEWLHIIEDPDGNYSNGNILLTNTFFPVSTSTVEWIGDEGVISSMQSSTLGGPCVQPPDVPCVLDCGPWSACVGGTRTRTCTVTTPPSGNVPPCPPLLQTEQCSVPACFPPTAVVATQTGSAVVISFTGVSGAASYQVSYSIDGGTPVVLSGASSPITLPYTCDATYTGTIVTQCTNGLTSSPVSWGPITTDACAFCNTEPARPMIGGYGITAPAGQTIALGASNDTTFALANLNFGSSRVINDITLTPLGYVYSGWFSGVSSVGFPLVSGLGSIVLINCDFTPNTTFFGSGFSTNSPGVPTYIQKVVYDANTNRLYVAGNFVSYKGVLCTPGFVVLNATTGNIDTTFATSTVGAVNSLGASTVNDITIQQDGKILVGGIFTSMYGNNSCKYLCRFTSTGVVDTSLNLGTSFTFSTPVLLSVETILSNSAGDIFVGGVFDTYQGVSRSGIVKMSSTGAINTTFNPGIIGIPIGCSVRSVYKIVYQGTQLLIGGSFNSFNGGGTPGGFARISDTTAAFDSSFTLYTPVGACPEVRHIVVKNNKIYLGTTYTQYGPSTKAKYYILNSNGTISTTTTVNITGGTGSAIRAILLVPF
jgi:hypothetical protein